MDTVHHRLAELADDAPTGGAPPEELWARGKRGRRLQVAGLAASLAVISRWKGTQQVCSIWMVWDRPAERRSRTT